MGRRIQKLDETLRTAVVGLMFLLTFTGAQAAELRCTPSLPVFCANVHVGCSGRTNLPTHGFAITQAGVEFDDGGAWLVEISVSDSGAVYRRKDARDWIRIAPDGAYSQRAYRERGPVMAYGLCQ